VRGVEEDEDAERLEDVNTPENELLSREIIETVTQALDDLPEELRIVITLRVINGLRYEAIARITNSPIGTVRSRIFRARERLAERLRPHLDTPRDKKR
jgi:RNA polymerase sigma-70 factor, ECF subfamily